MVVPMRIQHLLNGRRGWCCFKTRDGSFLHQYLATFTALLIIVTSGMHYAWPSPSLPKLLNGTDSITITSDEGSWIAIMEMFSAPIGCTFTAFGVDIIGRKTLVLATAVPFFVAWIMVAYAGSILTLCLARLLAGLADGVVFTALPLYIGEIADPKIRGLLGSSTSSAWIMGMLLINIIGSYCSIQLTAFISSICPVIFLLTFVWMPESPYYFILKGNLTQARKSLEKFRGTPEVDDELTRLTEAVEQQSMNSGKFLDLFTKKSNRRALMIIAILRNGQQLSGIAAITFYTQQIFSEGGEFVSPEIATFIYVTMQLTMAAVCAIVIDKTGRRPLLFVSLIGSGLSLFLQGTYFYLKTHTNIETDSFNYVPIIALLGFVILFHFGMQPIPLLMQGEMFPTSVKAAASCLSEVYFCALASVTSKFFQMMNDRFGMYLPFYVFSFCCFFNLIFVAVFVPETKGKTLEQIQHDLARNVDAKSNKK